MKIFKKGYLSIGQEITLSKRNCSATSQEIKRVSKISYASVVGSIMYAMTYTRSDVTYSLGVVSRYQSDPVEKHWKITKVILKYLRNTKSNGLSMETLIWNFWDILIPVFSQIVMTAEVRWATYLPWMEELFAEKILSNILWLILYAKWNTLLHRMLQRSGVVVEVHQRARSYTFHWWSYPTVLWQLQCHSSGERT